MDNVNEIYTDGKLPPLPASDPESITQNKYNGFYGTRSREYWRDAEVNLHHLKDITPCVHFFLQKGLYIRCFKCNAGFRSSTGISAENGKLLINNLETVI